MYVIKYMKLIRTRTSQRVFVGLDAAPSSVEALDEADVRFMSGILALVLAGINWNEENAGPTRYLGGRGFRPDVQALAVVGFSRLKLQGLKAFFMRH